ncbi:BP80 [Symbiodinium natans]|uniref:BP80 protein n=1 Tax=Symbiodinium natans TaxID=878477 RepID=A0A812LU30_9DINO|nr:BP80 [Symbiodinium natans]
MWGLAPTFRAGTDPDGGGQVTGREVILEDVRQLCIHELTVAPTGESHTLRQPEYAWKWWSYVAQFLNECPTTGTDPLHMFGKQCSERVMRQIGIDVEKVQECELTTQDEKLKYQLENSAWSEDALRINGWRYSGTMDADLVTKAICAGFVVTPEPCARLAAPANPFNVDNLPRAPEGVSNSQLMEVFIILAVLAVGFMYFYKRSLTRHVHTALREEVMLEVQSQMAQYKQLGDL